VQPADRIRKWNIRPGDKVRLRVGKPREKFLDEKEKASGGYKVYNVKSVDMEKNWLYLDGLSVCGISDRSRHC
jgi:large subunit ribosomal protein L24